MQYINFLKSINKTLLKVRTSDRQKTLLRNKKTSHSQEEHICETPSDKGLDPKQKKSSENSTIRRQTAQFKNKQKL